MSNRYKCPACECVAEIDLEEKKVAIFLPRGRLTFPAIGHACELAKAVDQIDLSKLEKLE